MLAMLAMLYGSAPTPVRGQGCCGSPGDDKKIPVHLRLFIASCGSEGTAKLNVKWTEPAPSTTEHPEIVNQTVTIVINNSQSDYEVKVPFGAEVKADITNINFTTFGGYVGVFATLSTPCPDSQELRGYVNASTNAQGQIVYSDENGKSSDGTMHLTLRVAPLDETTADGDCAKDLGSVRLAFSMGRLAEGKAGVIWLEEPTISGDSYTRNKLHFPRNHGEAGMRVVFDGTTPNRALRQVCTPTMLADIVDDAGGGYEIRFYAEGNFGPAIDLNDPQALYSPNVANCFRKWKIDGGTAAGQLRVRGYDATGVLIPGSEAIYSQSGGTIELSEGGTVPRLRRRTVISGSDAGYPGQTVETRTITVRNPTNPTVALTQRVEKLIGGRIVEVRNGIGGDTQITRYAYGSGADSWQVSSVETRLTNNTLIGRTATTWSTTANGELSSTTASPFKDSPSGRERSDTPTSSTESIGGTPVSETGTSSDDVPNIIFSGPFGSVTMKVSRTTRTQYVGNGTALSSRVWTITDPVEPVLPDPPLSEAALAAAKFLKGRTLWEKDADGLGRHYQYAKGTWAGETFTANTTGSAILETVQEGLQMPEGSTPVPVPTIAVTRTTVTNAKGNVVCEQTAFPGGGLTKTLHTYDVEGHLVSSEKVDGTGTRRTIYSATWVNNRKVSETDETGAVTNFSNFDAQGRPWTIVRAGRAAFAGLPAIPAQTTNLIYDAAGRKMSETVAGSPTRSWTYDSLGRVKSETVNGMATTYQYQYAATGGLTVTKTFPNGATAVTAHYLDGQVKSITGTGVVPQIYDYTATGESVTTGAAADPMTVTTSRDWLGRTVTEQRTGLNSSTNYYNSDGRLHYVTRAPLGQINYSYNLTGIAPISGTTANVSTVTVNGGVSPSQSVATGEYYATESDGTYRVTETNHGTTKEKVAGFAAAEMAKTVSTDRSGVVTTTTTTLDSANAVVTQTTMRSDITNQAVVKSRLGLTQSVLSFSGGNPVIYGYDGLGRQVSAKDPRTGTVTNTGYDWTTGKVSVIANGTLTTSIVYYSLSDVGGGQPRSRTVNGQTTYFAYDLLGRQTHVWGPAAYPLWYEYDGNGRLHLLHTYRTGLDSQWIGETWPSGAGPGDVTTWSYKPGTTLVASKTDAAGRAVNYTYYSSGLLEKRVWARGATTKYQYNGAGNVTDTSYFLTDASESVPEPDPDSATPNVSISYDNKGRPVGMDDAAGFHTLGYNETSGLFESDAVSGSIMDGMSLNVGHNASGQLSSLQVSKDGTPLLPAAHSFTYHPGTGRPFTAGDGTNTATYSYLPNSDWLNTTVIPGKITVTKTPDAQGRLDSIVTTRGATTVESHTWHYDAASRRDRDTLADGSFWSYSYNTRGEVTFGNKNLPTSVPAIGRRFGYSYDPIGNRKQTTVNTRVATYTANALNQYDQRTVLPVVNVLGSAAPGAVVTATSPDGTVTALRQGGDFAAEVPVVNKVSGQPAPKYPTIEIKGRVNEVNGQNAVTDTASIQSGKHFLAGDPEAFAYDEDGNLLRDGRWDYTWDGENRLIAVETRAVVATAPVSVPRTRIEYRYDGRGRRIQQSVLSGWNGTDYAQAVSRRFLYDMGWNVLAEIDGAGAVVRRCLWGLDVSGSREGAGGIGGLLVESIPDPANGGALTDCFPFYDGNGNITGLINGSGSEVARYEYGPFGETVGQSGPLAAANPWRWSTKWTEEATGLKDYGYRWLGDGRWLNRDPIEELGGQNLYGILNNDAVNNTDFLGMGKTKAIGYVVMRVGSKIRKLAPVFTHKEAARLWRAKGSEFIVRTRSDALKVARIAIDKKNLLRHKPHNLPGGGKGRPHVQDDTLPGQHVFWTAVATMVGATTANALNDEGTGIEFSEVYNDPYPEGNPADFLAVSSWVGENSRWAWLDWVNPGELVKGVGDVGLWLDRERNKKLVGFSVTVIQCKKPVWTFGFDATGKLLSAGQWKKADSSGELYLVEEAIDKFSESIWLDLKEASK